MAVLSSMMELDVTFQKKILEDWLMPKLLSEN